ncbi:MAG TPA: hypothetical protein VFL28_15400 [bacterium]|nr:hypothetical protein [bacterium]
MAVPTVMGSMTDRQGRPIRVGDKVKAPGIDAPAIVQAVDPRYETLVVLIAGRANQQMGRMVRAAEVEVTAS